MRTSISKDFRWEMGHRLPFHDGLCKNVHGHSYQANIVLIGEPDQRGMVMDYYDMKSMVAPLIDALDHCFMCDKSDSTMQSFLVEHGMKTVVVDFPTTAENIARMLVDGVVERLPKDHHIDAIRVRVYETEKTYAEVERSLT